MINKVYIIGHKNPDTDSVAAAISYSCFKNAAGRVAGLEQDALEHTPAMLGDANKETQFVLECFKVKMPQRLAHLKIRAKDVMSSNLITVTPDTSVRDAGNLLYKHNIRAIPVVDGENCLKGIITERNIAHRHIEEVNVRSLVDTPVKAGQITETLDGKLVVGDPEKMLAGNVGVGAMEPETMVKYINKGDIVILGNRENAQLAAIRERVSALVITGDLYPTEKIISLAKREGVVIILTPHDTFAAVKLINLSIPVELIMEEDFLILEEGDLLSEVIEDVLSSALRLGLVVDSENHLLGIVTRQDLVSPAKRRVILVDHNEMSQSAPGIEEAQILEVIDHHRLGDIQTGEPILVINRPVGSTSTIIFKMFKEKHIDVPAEIAGIMLAAILSDTVLMKSPTTTEEDRAAVSELAGLASVNAVEFGVEMYRQASDIESASPKDLILGDLKLYEFSGIKLGIGQLETIDSRSVLKRKREILNAMDEILSDRDYDGLFFMITDILREGTDLLVVGKTRIAEKAFEKKLTENCMFLPGVISRKKQVAPPLARFVTAK